MSEWVSVGKKVHIYGKLWDDGDGDGDDCSGLMSLSTMIIDMQGWIHGIFKLGWACYCKISGRSLWAQE